MLASELAHFVVHDELHQLQACLAHQLADALLQGGGDFFERQVQLQFLPGFFGLLVELANGLFAVNLVSFLHSDSPFSKMKNITPNLTARTGESLLSTNYRTSSEVIVADVTDEAGVGQIARQVQSTLGVCDILINKRRHQYTKRRRRVHSQQLERKSWLSI